MQCKYLIFNINDIYIMFLSDLKLKKYKKNPFFRDESNKVR